MTKDGGFMDLIGRNRAWCLLSSLIVVMLLASSSTGYGQGAAFATIRGRVLDPKGAFVPNATVTATNTETGLTRTAKTTSEGVYRVEDLTPGIYDLSLESAGFSGGDAKGVRLQIGEQRDIDFKLELAGQKQFIVVSSQLPLIEP